MTDPPRIAVAAHRLMLRSASTPLGRLWPSLYRATARAWAAYLTWGERGAAAYERAGVAAGEVRPGLSDIDVAIVLKRDPGRPGAAAARVRERWQRIRRRWPSADLLLDYPRIHEEPELRSAAGESVLTYGLDRGGEDSPPPAVSYLGDIEPDLARMLERPGLFGATSDWRLMRGPELRPPEPPRDDQARRVAGWLELAYSWRSAIALCARPTGPRAATLCVRSISEPARIWLWLVHGEATATRSEALQRAAERLPDEPALTEALELNRSLMGSPEPPADLMLGGLVRLTARIAAHIERELRDLPRVPVRLRGADPARLVAPPGFESGSTPMCDWRGIVCPRLPDESFESSDADPADPEIVAAAAAASARDFGPYLALRAGDVTIWPILTAPRNRMRAIQCPATDPVGFALMAGRGTAAFPEARGWSVSDVARRAVAEHAVWLAREPESRRALFGDAGQVGRLFTAARAALLLRTLRAGSPELPLTVAATAELLAEQLPGSRDLIEQAAGEYAAWTDGAKRPSAATAAGMSELVRGLAAESPSVDGTSDG